MFEMFPNFWTPVLPEREVGKKPVAVELAGEKLVLFRNSSGEIITLSDCCPHRGAALSLGQVTKEGCLECPYHGWQFDGEGNCTHVPFNDPEAINFSNLSAVSFPTRIIAGCVWVFTGQGNPPEPQLSDSLLHSKASYRIHQEVWNAHWSRVIESNLDFIHLPFVHSHSIAPKVRPAIAKDKILNIQVEHSEGRIKVFSPYAKNSSVFSLEWHQPNIVIGRFNNIGLSVPGGYFAAVPINRQQTRCMMFLEKVKGINPWSQRYTAQKLFFKPLREDRLIIETQPGDLPPISDECHVPTDKPTLLFRRWYHQKFSRQMIQSLN